nr:MAG TPA: hypothetical protein [Caudoviricetes sp.]
MIEIYSQDVLQVRPATDRALHGVFVYDFRRKKLRAHPQGWALFLFRDVQPQNWKEERTRERQEQTQEGAQCEHLVHAHCFHSARLPALLFRFYSQARPALNRKRYDMLLECLQMSRANHPKKTISQIDQKSKLKIVALRILTNDEYARRLK